MLFSIDAYKSLKHLMRFDTDITRIKDNFNENLFSEQFFVFHLISEQYMKIMCI